jgi:signal transduction histidine kinase
MPPAEQGVPGRGVAEAIPLVFAGEAIGQLAVESRVGDAGLTGADRRLLGELAGSVAIAAHAVRLSGALTTSRARLVSAREEERRRLRRDLHDGLGPTLFGLALGMDGVARTLGPEHAEEIARLERLRAAAEGAVADVRRLVDDLRPRALDHLGLAGAVGEEARRLGAAVVDVPAMLRELPPAVEVTAYRIAAEALANAVRHAAGTGLELRLRVDGDLRLDVLDAGPGLPDGYRAGVGISSMRERAALLGGTCTIERRRPRGTAVRVRLPLSAP